MPTIEPRSGKWRGVVRRKGYPHLKKTFKRKADAEKWARQIESEMDRGIFVSRREAENTTLGELLDRYANEISEKKKGVVKELSIIKIFKETDLAKMYIAAIQGKDLAKYRDKLISEKLSGSTIKRRFSLLQNLYNVAIKEWSISGIENQVQKITIKVNENERNRRLNDGEEEKLLKVALEYNTNIHNIIIFALETAMRRSEITALLWNDINFQDCIIKIRISKNGFSRTIPMSIKCKEVLNSLTIEDDKVFNIRNDSITQAFSRICDRAKIEDLRFHDLRHEAVSRLFEKDFNIMEAASVSGHKDLRMLKRYTHLKAENLVEKMG
ncbi:MAG: tyrosine-type recombinase/integrase [Acidithiobacillus sp.]|uniref:integrase n=1 Tax=Acidithiobacillus ferrooxidans TaxID=920 RepID=UPI00214C54A0|nr:site-specific integrase [Acidithiobacillus ferrooxidans]MCR2830477.1 site-specific integrase [Acidithiobacillus ferrooxidans]